MLPSRLGVRFALEALFLILVGVGAGLADLRPIVIVLVMVGAWLLVALIEFTAERSKASALSYVLPPPAEVAEEEGEPERVHWPPHEERTVVAPPEPGLEPEPEPEQEAEEPAEVGTQDPVQEVEPEPQPAPAALSEPHPEAEPEPEPEPEREVTPLPVLAEETEEPQALDATEPEPKRRRRFLRRRRERDEEQPPPPTPPRHVRLLPRRPAPEDSESEQELAELFGAGERQAENHEERGA
jgi:hypothetical protein